jgi:branched-chain amino acid transport system permease protein
MLGAYIVYYVGTLAGLNYFYGLLIAAVVMGLLGVVLEKFMFRRLRANMEPAILAAIGLTLIFQTLAVILFGSYTKYLQTPEIISGVIVFGGIRLPQFRLTVMLLGIVLTLILLLVIRRTRMGRAMVAISQDAGSAALMGINVNRISAVSLGIGSALAAIAGGLMGTLLQLTPFMGTLAITKGIAVVILGGIGSIPGAILGGLILGFVDGLVPLATNMTIANIAGFCIIILILLAKPRGLFGHD